PERTPENCTCVRPTTTAVRSNTTAGYAGSVSGVPRGRISSRRPAANSNGGESARAEDVDDEHRGVGRRDAALLQTTGLLEPVGRRQDHQQSAADLLAAHRLG